MRCRTYYSLPKLVWRISPPFKWFFLLHLLMEEEEQPNKTNSILCLRLIKMLLYPNLYKMLLALNTSDVMDSTLPLHLQLEWWWWVSKAITTTVTKTVNSTQITSIVNHQTTSTYKEQTLKAEKLESASSE